MSRSPTKILFLTSSYPRNKEDMASIFLRNLAEHVASLGVVVHILAPAEGNSETTAENGIVVHRFQYLPKRWQALAYGSGIIPNLRRAPWLWFQVPFFVLAMSRKLIHLLRTQKFDLIHAHWILPQGLVAALASALFRIPFVVTAHGTDAFALQGKFATHLKHLILKRSAAWTANTHATADAVSSSVGAPRPRIIPMGVDIGRFSHGNPILLRRGVSQDDIVLLFVGRLIAHKGCHHALAAMSLLPLAIRARIRFWIIGDGDQRVRLKQIIDELDLGENVQFLGNVAHQYLPDFYAAADIVVVPSLEGSSGEAEGQALVILEAFAARTCVVATGLGGITSMVKDRVSGLLVEPNNPSALCQAFETLVLNPLLRAQLAESAFAGLNTHYDWDHIATRFAALYREVHGFQSAPGG